MSRLDYDMVRVLDEAAGWDDADAAAVVELVAYVFAERFARHTVWGTSSKVTTSDVRAALIGLGAAPFTVDVFAGRLAAEVRRVGRFGVRREV